MIDLTNKSKAQVLAILYNTSKPQGLGIFQFTSEDMSIDEAQELLDSGFTYFDYVRGRVMKIDLKGDKLDTRAYNRDNGHKAAELALANL